MLGLDISKIQGNPLRMAWDRMHVLPGGKRLFSRLVGQTAPYTGTIGAQIETLRDGYCQARLVPRRRIENHLNSIHAVALMNLGEMCSGVAMMYTVPGHIRGIVTHMEMDYEKKARGVIEATCDAPPVRDDGTDYEQQVETVLRDREGDVVARFRAVWKLGPKARG